MKRRTRGGTPPSHTRGGSLIVSRLVRCGAADNQGCVVAIQALTQTVVHLTQSGRFRQAADREKEIGQIYLQESNDLRKACESFERAGDWYAQEDATA